MVVVVDDDSGGMTWVLWVHTSTKKPVCNRSHAAADVAAVTMMMISVPEQLQTRVCNNKVYWIGRHNRMSFDSIKDGFDFHCQLVRRVVVVAAVGVVVAADVAVGSYRNESVLVATPSTNY